MVSIRQCVSILTILKPAESSTRPPVLHFTKPLQLLQLIDLSFSIAHFPCFVVSWGLHMISLRLPIHQLQPMISNFVTCRPCSPPHSWCHHHGDSLSSIRRTRLRLRPLRLLLVALGASVGKFPRFSLLKTLLTIGTVRCSSLHHNDFQHSENNSSHFNSSKSLSTDFCIRIILKTTPPS